MKQLGTALLVLAGSALFGTSVYANSDSNWVYIEDVDLFTDQNSSKLILEPTQEIGYDAPDAIVLRCNSTVKKGIDVFVPSGGYLDDDPISIRYRFGTDISYAETWEPAVDGEAAFAQDLVFAEKLLSGEDFIFEVTDYSGETAVSRFENDVHPKMKYFINGCKTDEEITTERKNHIKKQQSKDFATFRKDMQRKFSTFYDTLGYPNDSFVVDNPFESPTSSKISTEKYVLGELKRLADILNSVPFEIHKDIDWEIEIVVGTNNSPLNAQTSEYSTNEELLEARVHSLKQALEGLGVIFDDRIIIKTDIIYACNGWCDYMDDVSSYIEKIINIHRVFGFNDSREKTAALEEHEKKNPGMKDKMLLRDKSYDGVVITLKQR